ncbi:MAG: S8 family peptidase [Flavobacteriales bacterium]|jgi:hypothetical protein
MKKSFWLALVLSFTMGNSCKHEHMEGNGLSGELVQKANPVSVPEGSPYDQEEVRQFVLNTLEREGTFTWEMADWKMQWSATHYGDQTVAIGYKPADLEDINPVMHKIDLTTGAWKEVHDNLIAFIVDGLNKNRSAVISWEEIVIEDDPVLPILTVRMTDKEVLTALYNLKNVRYIEPLDYWPFADEERSTSGCSASTTTLNTADWTTTTPNCRVPWNYPLVGIPAAWNTAQGQGITIGVIDAGISSSQSLLSSGFNSGDSNVGRSVSTGFTWGNSAFSSCTHGTSMSGTAVGPRNDVNATTGVAYRSGLHFIRGCEDVVLDKSSERTGVKNALIQLGNNSAVRIVSMSVGTPFSSSVLQDGCVYAHNMGKMLFAAAGTSFSWTAWWGVVYPAAYSQCIAVTGVKENGSTCSSCHDGSQVIFTIPMERGASSSRNSLSLAASGTSPAYIGGSSVATATAAGIAAIVWSVNPSMSRTQVYNCLLTTSQYYPTKTSSRGYGNLNASAAVNAALQQ